MMQACPACHGTGQIAIGNLHNVTVGTDWGDDDIALDQDGNVLMVGESRAAAERLRKEREREGW